MSESGTFNVGMTNLEMQCNLHILIYILSTRIFRIFWLGVAVVKRSTLEMDSSWAILCGTNIQVGLGPQ